MRPAEAREAVDDRLGQITVGGVFVEPGRTVALGELFAVVAEHRRGVAEHRRLLAKRAEDVDLPRRVHHVSIATDDVADLHVDVVHHHAEVVRRHTDLAHRRLPRDHQIVELAVGDLDAALHRVVPRHHAVVRVAEADHRQHTGRRREALLRHVLRPPVPVVARLFVVGLLLFAQGIKLLHTHVAVVGTAVGQHLRHHLAVARHALHLIEGAFVDIQAQPGHVAQDTVGAGFAGALEIGVLDPQHKLAVVMAGIGPRKQRSADVAEVQGAGG